MRSDWPMVRLGDHVESSLGKMLDKKKNKGIEQFYLGNSNVRWGEFDLTDLSKMRFEAHEFERYVVKSGDLIVCEGGEPGRCAIWNEQLPNMRIQKALHRIRCKPSLSVEYLFYWFLNAGKTGALEPYFTGTTIKHLTGKALSNLTLPLPPRKYQDDAARILTSLDKKIQKNKQINQTLEQMAQAIFKSWFVDFDPVKAKIAALEAGGSQEDATRAAMQAISGKEQAQLSQLQAENAEQYNELRTTAELFPSAMQDSELGEIPEGWENAPFSDIARLDTNSVKPWEHPEKCWEHYSIPAFDEKRFPLLESGASIKSNKYRVNESAILSSKLNPHFPRTWIPDITDPNAAICSTEFMQFVPKDPRIRYFLVGLVTSTPFQNGLMIRVTGSTGSRQRAQPKQVMEMDILTPPEKIQLFFSKRVKALYLLQSKNIRTIEKLANIRDALLPRLLAGDILDDLKG